MSCERELCPLWNGDGRFCAGEMCDEYLDGDDDELLAEAAYGVLGQDR